MARPERNNVDYFPFYCDEGQKMFYIEKKYGNDGFATFIKILRELAKKDFHYLNLNEKSSKMFLAAKCNVSEETLVSIINDLCELGKFDKDLWSLNIIWCQDFIDSIQDAYGKRNNKCITLDGLRTLLSSLGVKLPSKLPIKVADKPQSIVEYSIEEESKEKETSDESDSKPKKFNFKNSLIEYGFNESLVDDWMKVRKTKKATNTETAFNLFINEIEKRDCNLNEIMAYIVAKSWKGFSWDWIDNERKSFAGGEKKSNLEVLSEAYFDTSLEDKYKAMGD